MTMSKTAFVWAYLCVCVWTYCSIRKIMENQVGEQFQKHAGFGRVGMCAIMHHSYFRMSL